MTKTISHLFYFALITALFHHTYAGLIIPIPASTTVFYTQENKGGDSFTLSSSSNVPTQYDDQTMSFVVRDGYLVTLYEDQNQQGASQGPYTVGTYNVEGALKGKVSSVTITQVEDSYLQQNCAQFFTETGEQGQSFYACNDTDVPLEYRNQVNSVKVPEGKSVIVYDGSQGTGQSWGPYSPGSYDLTEFDSETVSVRLFSFSSNCPTFYDDYYSTGNSFQFCHSGPLTTKWELKVFSFTIRDNYVITGYGGSNVDGPFAAGSYNFERVNAVSLSIEQQSPAFFTTNCAQFFNQPNLQGDSWYICGRFIDMPAEYNDQAASVIVPPNRRVTLYANLRATGANYGTYTTGVHNSLPPDASSTNLVPTN